MNCRRELYLLRCDELLVVSKFTRLCLGLYITRIDECQLNVEVNNHDSPSSTYSLCCSESGFSSDADHFLTCQATDQFDLSNPNFVISNLFNTKFQNAKSFSSVNHYIRSQSSSCLWTSSTGSNDSEAISDPPSGLFHGIYNRTPTKLVSSSVECNGKSGQNDKGKTNEYKYPAKQSKCTSDICFRRTSSLEDSGCNNSNIRSANHHNLGSPYSRFRSSDSGLKPGCVHLSDPYIISYVNGD
ncbi:unnamed protein product [Schistosoma turkestanicum]|nr:unnamed protein product [Schistosoma turkestanicum]